MKNTIDLVRVETPNGVMYVHPSQVKRPTGLGNWWGELLNMAMQFNVGTFKNQQAADAAKKDFEQTNTVLQDQAEVDYNTLERTNEEIRKLMDSYQVNKSAIIWLGTGIAAVSIAAILLKNRKNGV